MQIEYVDIDSIKPYENNTRLHTTEQINQIMESIKEFGNNDPIGVWHDEIVEGHGRYEALKKLGYKEIPIIRLDNLTDEQRKAYGIVHNKLTDNSEFDFSKLDAELEKLKDIDMSQFGIEIEGGVVSSQEILEDEVPEPPEEPKSKLGDIYQLGNHRLMCGDSTNEDDVNKLMNGEKADMVFTDPPYGMCLNTDWSSAKSKSQFYQEKSCKGTGNKYERVIGDNDDFKPELITTIFDNFDYCKEIFVWGADYYPEFLKDYKLGNMFVWDKRSNEFTDIEYVEQSDKMYGSQFELCWSKNKHRKEIARVKWAGIFGTEVEFDRHRVHPTQKPSKLSGWFIDKYSKENDVIVDIYGGSGSTLIACEQLNRRCYMMELDPHYIDVIIQRWENLTGKKAVKINE